LLYRSNPFVIASVLCFICGTSLSILLHFPFIRRSNLIRVSLSVLQSIAFALLLYLHSKQSIRDFDDVDFPRELRPLSE
jgi:hypothetical protein